MKMLACMLFSITLPAAALAQDPVMAGQAAVLDSMNYNAARSSYRRAGKSDAEFKRDMRRAYARRGVNSTPDMPLTAAERHVRNNPTPQMRRSCAKLATMRGRMSAAQRRDVDKWCVN